MNKLRCPECLSDNLIKVGFVWSGKQLKQQYRCKDCARLTIKPIVMDKQKRELVPKPA